jgi:hypothetical protein
VLHSHKAYCDYYGDDGLECENTRQHFDILNQFTIMREKTADLEARIVELEGPQLVDILVYDANSNIVGSWLFNDDGSTGTIKIDDQYLFYRYSGLDPLVGTPENIATVVSEYCDDFDDIEYFNLPSDKDPVHYLWLIDGDIYTAYSGVAIDGWLGDFPVFVSVDGTCDAADFEELQELGAPTVDNEYLHYKYRLYEQHPLPWTLSTD